MEFPNTGRLRIAGQAVSERAPPLAVAWWITIGFQRPVLPSGTVWDNGEFGLQRQGLTQSARRVKDVLDDGTSRTDL